MASWARGMVTKFNKEMHVRPVMWFSSILSVAGFGMILTRAFAPIEYTMESYIDQNEINIRTIHERELNAEFYLLLQTDKDSIPVRKRHIWQMAGHAENIFNAINTLPPAPQRTIDQQKRFERLYKHWLSQIYDIYWAMAEQRSVVTPQERRRKQTRQYAVLGLPPAKPFTIRPFPDFLHSPVDFSVQPPPEDAPRSEFVNYYARRHKLAL